MARQARALFGAPISLIFNYYYIYHILKSESQLRWVQTHRFKKIEQRAGAFTCSGEEAGMFACRWRIKQEGEPYGSHECGRIYRHEGMHRSNYATDEFEYLIC